MHILFLSKLTWLPGSGSSVLFLPQKAQKMAVMGQMMWFLPPTKTTCNPSCRFQLRTGPGQCRSSGNPSANCTCCLYTSQITKKHDQSQLTSQVLPCGKMGLEGKRKNTYLITGFFVMISIFLWNTGFFFFSFNIGWGIWLFSRCL